MNVKQKGSPRTLPDTDLPEITDADLYHGEKLARRGRPKLESPRQLLSLRLPPQVIDRWKASGPGWQTRVAEALEKSAPNVPGVADS